ncbi:hypothetical protein DSTSK_18860 [Desulforhabdus sp. TSK]|nr:hypothetical protein DSTSK_18860 [Desulforhabdus sp. TSK]
MKSRSGPLYRGNGPAYFTQTSYRSNAVDPALSQLLFHFLRNAFWNLFKSKRSATLPAAQVYPASGTDKSQFAFASRAIQDPTPPHKVHVSHSLCLSIRLREQYSRDSYKRFCGFWQRSSADFFRTVSVLQGEFLHRVGFAHHSAPRVLVGRRKPTLREGGMSRCRIRQLLNGSLRACCGKRVQRDAPGAGFKFFPVNGWSGDGQNDDNRWNIL